MNLEYLRETYPESPTWDGFDGAIIGMTYEGKFLYDISMMLDILIQRDNMTAEEAMEYLDYNVFNAYIGELTPIHVYVKGMLSGLYFT